MKTNKSGYTKNSTGTLVVNPNLDAYSYSWYKLGMLVGETYILNVANYSSTTMRHFRQLRDFIKSKDIEIKEVVAPEGLQNLSAAQDYYTNLMHKISVEMRAPRKRETTRKRLAAELIELEKQYNFVMELMQNEKQNIDP